MKPDHILKTSNDDIYYSEDYLISQIELAYQSGISAGIQVEFHATQPNMIETVIDYEQTFWKMVNERYQQMLNDGFVYKVASIDSLPKKRKNKDDDEIGYYLDKLYD